MAYIPYHKLIYFLEVFFPDFRNVLTSRRTKLDLCLRPTKALNLWKSVKEARVFWADNLRPQAEALNFSKVPALAQAAAKVFWLKIME